MYTARIVLQILIELGLCMSFLYDNYFRLITELMTELMTVYVQLLINVDHLESMIYYYDVDNCA